jgi:hypothetical protein
MAAQDLAGIYDEDLDQGLYVWSCRNAKLLREGRYTEADVANIAEEIESLGKEQVHGLGGQLSRLLMHLLKYQHQPLRRSRSSQVSIVNSRIRISRYLRDNPSLRLRIDELMPGAYQDAVKEASVQAGLPKQDFPAECPYTFQQVMDDDFLPE